MSEYAYLDHVEAEFLGEDENLMSEAEEILRGFFQWRTATWNRAISSEELRYIVFRDDEDVKVMEEQGSWDPGEIEPDPENDYELIYERNEKIKVEEDISASEAETYIL